MTDVPQIHEVILRLKNKVTDPEQAQLVAKVTADLTTLLSRQLAGDNVAAEIAHLKATALNIGVANAEFVKQEILGFVNQFISAAIVGAITG